MMLVLDTNVVSELMKTEPDARVVKWLDAHASDLAWITSITIFEISFGLACLPNGRRKQALSEAFRVMVVEDIDRQVLDFGRIAAERAGEISSRLHKLGRPVEIRDVQIAGIVSARNATLATRNLKHFRDAGIHLVDPWNEGITQ